MYIYKNVISRAMFLNVFLLYLSLDSFVSFGLLFNDYIYILI